MKPVVLLFLTLAAMWAITQPISEGLDATTTNTNATTSTVVTSAVDASPVTYNRTWGSILIPTTIGLLGIIQSILVVVSLVKSPSITIIILGALYWFISLFMMHYVGTDNTLTYMVPGASFVQLVKYGLYDSKYQQSSETSFNSPIVGIPTAFGLASVLISMIIVFKSGKKKYDFSSYSPQSYSTDMSE